MIRVLLVDDHDIVRFGLSAYLSTVSEIEVIGEAATGEAAVRLGMELEPDVILMDLLMPGLSGVEATRQLREQGSTAHIVVLTSSVDEVTVVEAVRAGASSYVLKTSTPSELARVILNGAIGQTTLDAKVQQALLRQMGAMGQRDPFEELTERERDVLRALSTGKNNQEIADALGIGVKTVKTHIGNIFVKLDVQDRTQAAIYAVRKGLA